MERADVDFQEKLSAGFGDGSGINRTTCTQCASHPKRITMPTPHHTIFMDWMLSTKSTRKHTDLTR